MALLESGQGCPRSDEKVCLGYGFHFPVFRSFSRQRTGGWRLWGRCQLGFERTLGVRSTMLTIGVGGVVISVRPDRCEERWPVAEGGGLLEVVGRRVCRSGRGCGHYQRTGLRLGYTAGGRLKRRTWRRSVSGAAVRWSQPARFDLKKTHARCHPRERGATV